MDAERYLRLNIGITPNVSLRTTFHGNKLEEDNPPNQKELEFPVDCDLTTVDCITSLVSSHPVVVFSKPYCPYCRRALEALGSLMGNESDPFVVDLTEIKDGSKVQGTLLTMTGRRTVPNVFIGGTSIGVSKNDSQI